MQEIWKDIPNFEALYQMSNLGRVRSKHRVRLQDNHGTIVEHVYPSKIIDIDISSGKLGYVNLYDKSRKTKIAVHIMYSVLFGWEAAEDLYFPNEFVHYADEQWVDIEGTDGLYQVSNYSQVRKRIGDLKKYGGYSYQMMHPYDSHGYWCYDLNYNGRTHKSKAHRLASIAFISNLDNKPYVNHKDGLKKNCNISNFEWCTPKENANHAWRTGLIDNDTTRLAHIQSKVVSSIPVYCPEIHRLFGTKKEAKNFFKITYDKLNKMLHDNLSYWGCTLEYADEVR